MMDLQGQRVLVMGLGLFGGGVGAVRYLHGQGARVAVTDLRPAGELAESLEALEGLPVRFMLGGHDEEDFRRADLIVANPGVPRSSPFLQAAEAAGVPVTTEICLFVTRCAAPIVGVTGSSGKTTTTALLGTMLRRARPDTLVGGNIGGSLLDRLGDIRPDTPVVLELSSFQLDRLGDLPWSPQVAVVTNFAPNHLDVHGSLEAYRHAKRQIVVHQRADDWAVLNGDDAEVIGWADAGEGRCLPFGLESGLARGVFVREGEIRHLSRGAERTICAACDLRLPGRHNLANALAACAGALCRGIGEGDIAEALRCFSGVEHRLERVGEIGGVSFYNDSIATSPDRTRVALEALAGEIVLIAGGYDKGLGFDRLGPAIGHKVSDLILLGKTADAIAASVPGEAPTRIHRVVSLEEAVERAAGLARPGSAVLFSPASASYDMFRNFDERGCLFKTLVATFAEQEV